MLPLAAHESLIGDRLIVPLGGGAAILAMLGMLLLLPLLVTQRREIARLRGWQERQPEAGEQGPRPAVTTAFRPSGPMTAAERVTSERPALARIGTAERAAIELRQAPFWRRVVIRGPRHPLVLSLGALALAVVAIFVVGLLLRAEPEGGKGGGVVHSDVDVVVLNASSSSGLAAEVGDDVGRSDFNVTGTTVAQDNVQKSVVRYADGAKPEARAVARSLGITIGGPFDPYSEAKADGADVVVIAGEDLVKARKSKD